jgi:hypothetical protein
MKSHHHLFLAAVFALAPLGAAEAGARDDVKSASARCDSINDEHTWLNCYYGAAQPVRAELGLPPAPDTQQTLVPPPGQPASDGKGFLNWLWPF